MQGKSAYNDVLSADIKSKVWPFQPSYQIYWKIYDFIYIFSNKKVKLKRKI